MVYSWSAAMAGSSVRSWRWERARDELLEKDDPLIVVDEVWVPDDGTYDDVDEAGYDGASRLEEGRIWFAVDR